MLLAARIGGVGVTCEPEVLDFLHLGSSLAVRAFARGGSALSVRGAALNFKNHHVSNSGVCSSSRKVDIGNYYLEKFREKHKLKIIETHY